MADDDPLASIQELVDLLNKHERSASKFGGMVDPRTGDGLVYMNRSSAEALLHYYQGQQPLPSLDDHHLLARVRELAAIAKKPLRDRWGFASSDAQVRRLAGLIREAADKESACDAIGVQNAFGDLQFCNGYDSLLDEEDEQALVDALWVLRS